jgi:predicted nucleic acid-binding protein
LTLIVSDSSPLNILICLGQEHVLCKLFDRVVIPPEVVRELSHARAPSKVRQFIATPPSWLSISAPTKLLSFLHLDAGETEAISLAVELQATLMIDERDGRSAATAHGLKIIGAVGILERAAGEGLIPDLKEIHAQIRGLKFRVSNEILADPLARHLASRTTP